MKFNYYEEIDSLYIDLAEEPSIETREIAPRVLLDFGSDGKLVGIDIDRASKKVTVYPYPTEWRGPSMQASMVSPNYWHVDGHVWSNNQETREHYRLNVATGQFSNMGKSAISAYGMPTARLGVPEASGEDVTETIALPELARSHLGRTLRSVLLGGR